MVREGSCACCLERPFVGWLSQQVTAGREREEACRWLVGNFNLMEVSVYLFAQFLKATMPLSLKCEDRWGKKIDLYIWS